MGFEIIYILFTIIALLIVFSCFLLIKQRDFFTEKILYLEQNLNTINIKNEKFQQNLELNQTKLSQISNDNLNLKFNQLNQNLTNNLTLSHNSFKQDLNFFDKSFKSLIEKITKIENNGEISQSLKQEISKLNQILGNQKLRGNFGEFELKNLLDIVFGENLNFYELQKTLPNGRICDCAINLGDKILCVDCKFLLSSYEKILNAQNDEIKKLNTSLLNDFKKEIVSISQKYIIPQITSEFAIMFVPSEAIFVYIVSNLPEILSFSWQNRIFITSPTTFMAVLNSIKILKRDKEISKNAIFEREKIITLGNKFEKFQQNSKNLITNLDKISKTTSNFIKNSDEILEEFDEFKKAKF